MLRFAAFTLTIGLVIACASVRAGDWIFDSGPYTDDAKTGQRVDQYQSLPEVDRIPFRKFYSEDGPHPYGMDWWGGNPYWYGGDYPEFEWGMSPYSWGGYGYGGPYIGPLGTP